MGIFLLVNTCYPSVYQVSPHSVDYTQSLKLSKLDYNEAMIKKVSFYLITIIFLSLTTFWWFYYPLREKESIVEVMETEEETEVKEITLYFVGDIMLDRGVLHYIEKNNDWRWPFLNIAEDMEKADLVFGNLESMISDKGRNVGSIYSFRAPPETMQGLVYAHFDILSVANNHSFDYTVNAFTDTLLRLKENNILYVGGGFNREEAHSSVIKEINDTKIGFLAYTSVGSPNWQAGENSPGIAWMDTSLFDVLKKDVIKAKEKADILVVSFHFGNEYQEEPSEKQQILANTALDAGADIIAGHHPHVVQPLEINEKGVIAYSLGNFIFDQYFSEETMRGAILKVNIREKEIISSEIIETKLNSEYQVEIVK